jgi:hypothetical protein
MNQCGVAPPHFILVAAFSAQQKVAEVGKKHNASDRPCAIIQ